MIAIAEGLSCALLCWLWLIVPGEVVGMVVFAAWMNQ